MIVYLELGLLAENEIELSNQIPLKLLSFQRLGEKTAQILQ